MTDTPPAAPAPALDPGSPPPGWPPSEPTAAAAAAVTRHDVAEAHDAKLARSLKGSGGS